MRIVDLFKIEHIVPNMSCGTGYSEPDKYRIVCDNGDEDDVLIDIWYMPEEHIKRVFKSAIKRAFGDTCENIDEAYQMYLKEEFGEKEE